MRFSTRFYFALLAAVSAGLLVSGLVLGELLRLQPCYLCNFQRLVYIVMAAIALCGVFLPRARRLWCGLFSLAAFAGVITAAQQSWMQYSPDPMVECGFGDPTLVERIVDWLGMQWPFMFMVTGFCSNKDWVFLGLSLANWSGVCFFALFVAAGFLFFRRETTRY